MVPLFSRRSALFLFLGVFALLFGMAQSASAATCLSYGDDPVNPEWQKAGNPAIDNCTIQYDDPAGGANLAVCQYRILSDETDDGVENPTTETLGWTNATHPNNTCEGSSIILQADVSIGDGLNCRHNGANRCRVEFKVADNAGNSATGTVVTLDVDYILPTVTNVTSNKANGSYTVDEVIDIDVTFSEAVTSTGNVTVTLETGTTDRTCVFTVSNADTGTCNYTVQVGDMSADLTVASISGTIKDVALNPMTSFVPTTNLAANKAIVIDTIAPTVTIDKKGIAPAQADPTNVSPINFTAVFSELVTGFTGSDVTITGTAGGTKTVTVTEIAPNDGTTYNVEVAVSGTTSSGTVIATITAGVATDIAGNNNAVSTSPTDNIVIYDITAPTIDSFTINNIACSGTPCTATITTNVAITIAWSSTDTGGSDFKQIEVWRAWDADADGGLDDSEWGDSSPVSGTQANPIFVSISGLSSINDDPAGGTYWYGLHARDNVDNCITEDTSAADKGHCGGVTSDSHDNAPLGPRPDRGPIKVVMDKIAPSTAIAPNGSTWGLNNAAFSLTCSDEIGGSGCSATEYKIVDSSVTCNTSGLTTSNSGTITCSAGSACEQKVCYRSSDNAGNVQNIQTSSIFQIDKKDPEIISFDVNPKKSDGLWVNTNNPNVTISWQTKEAVPNSGLKEVQVWRSDDNGLTWQILGSPLLAPSNDWTSFTTDSPVDGTYLYGIHAKDNAGNERTESEAGFSPIEVQVDKTPPTKPGLPGTTSPPNDATPTWGWAASEDTGGSGVWRYWIWWATDSDFTQNLYTKIKAPPSSFTHTTDLTQGTWYMKVMALDKAGNWSTDFSETGQVAIVLNQAPASPTSPLQFKDDESTSIPNQGFTNETNVKLRASATDADTSEVIVLFFEAALNSGSFASPATPTTGTSCTSGTSWSSCSNKIWYVSSVGGDPFTGTTSVAGLSTATGYKWQVKACDDDNVCSSWVVFNATTPNFSVDTQAPTVTINLQNSAGATITEVNQQGQPNDTLYIHVGSSTDNVGIAEVRFSSDDSQNGIREGAWTDWEQWDVSNGDWDKNTKRMAWKFAASGQKEVWAELKDTAGNTAEAKKNFYVNVNPSSSIYRRDGLSYVPDQDDSPEKLADNWKNVNFTRYIFDQDTDGTLSQCTWMATDMGEVSRTPCSNALFNSLNVTVGSGQACATQGENQCVVFVRNTDNDTASAPYGVSTYNADWADPVIQNNPSFAQSESTGTFSITASDNIELNYCWLYDATGGISYSLDFYENVCNQEGELSACPGGTNCKACRDMDFSPLQGHTLQVICSDQYDMETSLVTGFTTYLNTTSLGISSVFVTLSAVPSAGSVNTLFDLVATVSGTMTGNINYKFDCTNDGIWEREVNDSSVNPYTAVGVCQYPSPGTYTAKVFVQRGVGTAEDTATIDIFENTPPIVTNLQVDEGEYCFALSPPVILSWTFSDPGDSQSAYQVQIATDPGFSALVRDSCDPAPGTCASGNTSQSYAPPSLSYSTTYYWRVKVWDSLGDPSSWATGSSFITPIHAYPVPSFTKTPEFPGAQESVQFCSRAGGGCPTDVTTFAPGSINQSFSWDFGDPDSGANNTSALQNPSHSFTKTDSFGVTLQAGDDVGSCLYSQNVNVFIPFPEWQEISPF